MPSTWHDVMEALKECVTHLEEYEKKEAFKTTDEKRFYLFGVTLKVSVEARRCRQRRQQ